MIQRVVENTPVALPSLELPARPPGDGYVRPPREVARAVPDHAATLLGEA